MWILLTVIGVPLFGCLIWLAIDTLATLHVYGKKLPDDEVGKYLLKYADRMSLNEYDRERDIISGLPKYVARLNGCALYTWHISDIGVISRWSPWAKWLDDKRSELLLQSPYKSLKDL